MSRIPAMSLLFALVFGSLHAQTPGPISTQGKLLKSAGDWYLLVTSRDPELAKARLKLIDVPFDKASKAHDGFFAQVKGTWVECPGQYKCLKVTQVSRAVYDPLPSDVKTEIPRLLSPGKK